MIKIASRQIDPGKNVHLTRAPRSKADGDAQGVLIDVMEQVAGPVLHLGCPRSICKTELCPPLGFIRIFCQVVQQLKERRRLADEKTHRRKEIDHAHRNPLCFGGTND